MRNNNHPWRQTTARLPTIDPVVSSRSSRFAAYLYALPREERQRIEAAERAYVVKANSIIGRRQSTARDYARGMLGVKENEPARYRGFVA